MQDRMEANPEVLDLNRQGLEAYEKYLLDKEELGNLETRTGQLTPAEEQVIKNLKAQVSKFEKKVEESRAAIAEINEKIMKSA